MTMGCTDNFSCRLPSVGCLPSPRKHVWTLEPKAKAGSRRGWGCGDGRVVCHTSTRIGLQILDSARIYRRPIQRLLEKIILVYTLMEMSEPFQLLRLAHSQMSQSWADRHSFRQDYVTGSAERHPIDVGNHSSGRVVVNTPAGVHTLRSCTGSAFDRTMCVLVVRQLLPPAP